VPSGRPALTAELPRASAELVRRAVDANLRYYEAVGEVTLEYLRALRALASDRPPASGALTAPTAPTVSPPVAPTLVLEGASGETVVSAFLIENLLAERVSAPVTVSPFVAADGAEASVEVALDPEVVTLDPGEQTLVRAAASLSDAFALGVGYRAEISVPGLTGTRIPVVVRRREAPAP
jgi:hypothetical protein